jgi:hypothetical protein
LKQLRIFTLLLLVVLVGACSQSSDTTLNGGTQSTVPWVIPNVGTAYVFQLDGANPNIHPVDTIFILSTGQHIGGKTNVIDYADHAGTIGTSFFNIEANGDISDGYYTTNALGDTTYVWTTFPTGSLKPIADPVTDTIEQGIHIFRSNVRTFIGAENLVTLVGPFSTLHVRETSITIDSSNDTLNFNVNDTSVMDRWYAPSIALYVKVITSGISHGQPSDQSETDFIKYLPK